MYFYMPLASQFLLEGVITESETIVAWLTEGFLKLQRVVGRRCPYSKCIVLRNGLGPLLVAEL